MTTNPLTIVLATGGTGGHIFPAEALAETLIARGHKPIVITDRRFARYSEQSDSALTRVPLHYIPAVSFGSGLYGKLLGMAKNAAAMLKARGILSRVQPDAVIGFGGYPSFPTMLAATGRYPTLIHEQNALLGKANRVLAPRVDVIATSFEETSRIKTDDRHKVTVVGNPVRSAIRSLRGVPYPQLHSDGVMQLLVVGGSQGARVFGEVVPKAIKQLPEALRKRLRIDQQVRPEQLDELREIYSKMNVQAQLTPFFSDIPARLASAHLVIARSGASTVAELTCAARPAILVPLPRSADDHQTSNARALDDAGGAWLMPQDAFTAESLAARLESFLNLPASLERAAIATRELGRPEAAEQLADLVERTGRY